jgi:parallel beta-helix repeat protein
MNCIQDCLDSCSTGDTVLVGPGTYYENINWPVMQGIDLRSEDGPGTTIIDGGGTGRVIQFYVGVSSTTVIEGFTIQNGYDEVAGGGIYCGNVTSPLIKGNIITNNVADSMGAGIQCSFSSSPTIDSNTINNNTSHFVGAGIGCYEYSHPTIQRNAIVNNRADFGSVGICCVNSSPLITENTITGNIGGHWFGGIGAGAACAPNITYNTITNNQAIWGAGIGLEGPGVVTGNTISGNVADSMGGGIASYTNSSPLIDSNTISSNSAFKGGGIWVHESSHPTISNNTITENTAYSGAGIRCSNYSHPYIHTNTIANNTADSAGGGISCVLNSSPTITQNMISGNTANFPGGGAIFCMQASSPNIENNLIENNTVWNGAGGAIFCYTSSSPDIIGNTIINNNATRAAGIQLWSFSSPDLKYNVITYNSSPGYGCGIDCDSFSSPDIDSCTISYNVGHGIQCGDGSNPTINWVNIHDNTGFEVRNISPGITISAEYNWWGNPGGPPSGAVFGWVDYDPWLTDSVVWQTGIEESDITRPLVISLQVSPNPFRQMTDIRWQITDNGYITADAAVEIKIYDATGSMVKSFRISPYALRSSVSWDGRDDQNRILSSGVYFVKLTIDDSTESTKLLLIR